MPARLKGFPVIQKLMRVQLGPCKRESMLRSGKLSDDELDRVHRLDALVVPDVSSMTYPIAQTRPVDDRHEVARFNERERERAWFPGRGFGE